MTYPFGLYEGEPSETEILQRKEFRDKYGVDKLSSKHTCPACGKHNAEWVRNQWAICYDCLLTFDAFEGYCEPAPYYIQYVE